MERAKMEKGKVKKGRNDEAFGAKEGEGEEGEDDRTKKYMINDFYNRVRDYYYFFCSEINNS